MIAKRWLMGGSSARQLSPLVCRGMLFVLILLCPLIAESQGQLDVRTPDGAVQPWRAQLSSSRRTLVVFMTIWCKACERKQPELVRWVKANLKTTRTLFVFSGSPAADVKKLVRERGLPLEGIKILVDRRGGVARRYRISVTPTYLLFPPASKTPASYPTIASIPRG